MVSITPLCSMQYLAICNRVLFAHYKCILYVLLGASQGEWVQGVQEARVQGDHQAGVQDCSKASNWHYHNHSPHSPPSSQSKSWSRFAALWRSKCQERCVLRSQGKNAERYHHQLHSQNDFWLKIMDISSGLSLTLTIIRSAEKCARTLLRMSGYVCFYYFQIKHWNHRKISLFFSSSP